MTDADLLERLAGLDSSAVSDALDAFSLQGVVRGLGRLSTNRRIAGRVLTVRLAAAGHAASRHLCSGAIEAGGTGNVIVVEHKSREDCAGWGGILSLAAKLRGIEGVIVEGACRDIDESRALDFPVFARSVVPSTARGRVVEVAENIVIDVGGVAVTPGDFVIADGSGVVFISAGRAAEIIAKASSIAAREARMEEALREGKPVSQVMGADYETMLKGEL
jgi:4-hydroxy-4-methyl-2-oxoglutarate aldolase